MKHCSKCGQDYYSYFISCPFCENRLPLPPSHTPKSAEGKYILGKDYYYGKGVEKDLEYAFRLFLSAAQQNHIKAQYRVGKMLSKGEGVKNDMIQAFYWYMESSNQNYAPAQYEVGEAYYYAKGVGKNFEEAFSWYKRAASQNYAKAQYSVGYMYYYGLGVEKDRNNAVNCLEEAAKNGSKPAKELLEAIRTRNEETVKNENTPIKETSEEIRGWNDESILYVHSGDFPCKKDHHNIISATAILIGKYEKKIRLTVNYCQDCPKFFINENTYYSYREKYGILIGKVVFENNGKTKKGKRPLPDKSTLMLCGYNVNARNGLTARERHYIIAKLLDKKIMTKTEIEDHLNFCIKFNGANDVNARAVRKWQNDLEFTLRYKEEEQPEYEITDIKKWPGRKPHI